MQAKNGELAIARFDPVDEGERWEEKVCFVTGRDKSQTKFVSWDYFSNAMTVTSWSFGSLLRIRPRK